MLLTSFDLSNTSYSLLSVAEKGTTELESMTNEVSLEIIKIVIIHLNNHLLCTM